MVFWVNPFDEVIRMKSLKIGWRCLDFHWVQVDFKVQTLQIEERIIKLPRGCKRSGWMVFFMFFQRNLNIETYWMTLAYCQFTPIFDGQNHGFPSDFHNFHPSIGSIWGRSGTREVKSVSLRWCDPTSAAGRGWPSSTMWRNVRALSGPLGLPWGLFDYLFHQ